MSWMVRTLYEEIFNCIKLLPCSLSLEEMVQRLDFSFIITCQAGPIAERSKSSDRGRGDPGSMHCWLLFATGLLDCITFRLD